MRIISITIVIVYLILLEFSIFFGLQESAAAEGGALREIVEFTPEGLRDPFDSSAILKVEKKSDQEGISKEPEIHLPELKIQGIVWGGSHPVTIINGNVFKEGDTTVEGAIIIRIQKEGVELDYKGKNFLLPPPVKK